MQINNSFGRVVPGIQCSRYGIRVQREPAGPYPAYVRPQRVLLPPKRDLLHAEERVHGLGQARAEPAQRARRHARGQDYRYELLKCITG